MSTAFISKRIAVLESVLGCRLMTRSARGVQLTEQGQATLVRTPEILATYQNLRDDLEGPDSEPAGELRITASAVMGRRFIAPALAVLAGRYPALSTRLEIVDHRVNLLAEKIDIDVRVGGTHGEAEIVHPLASGRRILCASPAYLDRHGTPADLQALASHQCLLIRERSEPFGHWSLQRERNPVTVQISASLSSNDGEVVRRWTLDGLGIMLRSYWDISDSLASGELRQILPDYHQVADVVAVTMLRSTRSSRVRRGIECLREALRTGPLKLPTLPI